MNVLALQRTAIEPRLDGIQKDLELLRQFAHLSFIEFTNDVIIDRAQLHLRYILEGIFHIGSHILSRIPGGRYTEYKEIARKLGEYNIVPKTFAEQNLVKMAGYRNRLTHFYAEITPDELYAILQQHLSDVELFLKAVKKVVEQPEQFGLTIE
ncbi:MAG: DUF86 domain-containing protein [Candidatus Kerfeldbacteria bacterium]|nr:DUF86 domain-containing protein [Candidatus Kerfeldbacteria bacterium]